jgi:hypothetical protein
MVDDDLIIDENDPDLQGGGEEEDLLADMEGNSLDRLKSWEQDSQINSNPPMPAMGATEALSALLGGQAPRGSPTALLPVDEVLAGVARGAPVPVAPNAGRGLPVLVVDPANVETSPVEEALRRMGFAPTVCQTGAATRDELSRGRYRMVFLRGDKDPSWMRMLVITALQRWPNLQMVASLPAAAQQHASALKAAGVADVLPDPLPDDLTTLRALQALVPDVIPASAVRALTAPSLPAMSTSTPVSTPAFRPQGTPSRAASSAAVPATPPPTRMEGGAAPGSGKQDLARLTAELAAAQRRAADLDAQLKAVRAERDALKTQPVALPAGVLGDIKTLWAAHPYGAAMDAAIHHLGNAVGNLPPAEKAAAEKHIKNLRVVRAVHTKVQERLGLGPKK